uniref:Uncharacterized protein n=1 Tax=Anguilla anguilla TaxID=7936 RepID=A0A0E9PH53_ANGAN
MLHNFAPWCPQKGSHPVPCHH